MPSLSMPASPSTGSSPSRRATMRSSCGPIAPAPAARSSRRRSSRRSGHVIYQRVRTTDPAEHLDVADAAQALTRFLAYLVALVTPPDLTREAFTLRACPRAAVHLRCALCGPGVAAGRGAVDGGPKAVHAVGRSDALGALHRRLPALTPMTTERGPPPCCNDEPNLGEVAGRRPCSPHPPGRLATHRPGG